MRSVFAGLAVLAVAAVAPAVATAKDGQVRIVDSGNSPRSATISLASLGSPDVNNREYDLGGSEARPINGYSLARVLEAAEARAGDWLDLDTVPSVEIDRPSGGPIVLSRAQALDRDFFADGPPVFYEDNGTTVFVMPGASGSPGRAYVFRLAPPDVKVGDGAIYDVSLSHSPDRPRKGQPVTIRAQVSGVAPGTPLTYSWRFSDGPGKRTTVPRVVHRFGRAGGRWVSVTVSGGDGSGEGFRSIDVRQDDDGGDGGKPPDPTEPSVPSPTPTGSGFDGGGYGYGYGSGGFDQPGLSGQSSFSPEPSNEPEPAAPADGLEEVSGVLIDPAVSGGPTGDAQQVEADPAGGGFGFSGEAATLFGVGLLIALGGLIEVRVLSRRL